MSDKPFNPFDPVEAAMRAMHQGNMLAAKEAKENNLIFARSDVRFFTIAPSGEIKELAFNR